MPFFSVQARWPLAMTAALVLSACAQSDQARQNHAGHMAHAGHAGHAAPTTQAPAPATLALRTVVEATPQEIEHVLGDMQKLLRSVGEINGALAARDWTTIERVANSLRPEHTMGSRDPAAVSFHAKLPPEWFALARPTHQNFMAIAQEARANPSVDTLLPRLAATSQQCVACHATYRLSVKP